MKNNTKKSGQAVSRYNALLKKRGTATPVAVVIDMEIPEELNDDQRLTYAAIELMENFRIILEPV